MPIRLTSNLVKTIRPKSKIFEVRDADVRGLLLRIFASGSRSYVCQYGRGKRIIVGPADLISLEPGPRQGARAPG